MKAFAVLLLALMYATATVDAGKDLESSRKQRGRPGPALRCSNSSDCTPTECCIRKGSKSFCKPLEKLRRKCSTLALEEQFIKYCPCGAGMTCTAKTELKSKKYGICKPATNGTASVPKTRESRRKDACRDSSVCRGLKCCTKREG